MSEEADLSQQFEQWRRDYRQLREQVEELVLAQGDAIEAVLTALLAGGHVLLEGVPGLGKTYLAKVLAEILDLQFRRIQFTPDLMPADVIGTYVVLESHGRRKFEFQQGPLFANLVLADEINRATPKTQGALLEGLEEGVVTVANETYDLPRPFFVVATQGPADSEGTFPLPETQLDRFFFKVNLPFPDDDQLDALLERTTEPYDIETEKLLSGERLSEMIALVPHVTVAPEIRREAVRLIAATHPDSPHATEKVKQFVAAGSSPRGGKALLLGAKVQAAVGGRMNIAVPDLHRVALPALRHRITLNYEGHAEQIDPDDVVREIIAG